VTGATNRVNRRDNGPPALSLSRVCHDYVEGAGVRSVLKGVDLEVDRGEIVALLGRSGCGKTTLLNLISGIETLQSGSIAVDGRALDKLDEAERTRFRRRHIGFIYQFFQLFPTLTAAENIALVLELNGFSPARSRARVQELLTSLQLADRAGSFPDKLSGGEQQRIAIARAIAHRPALILADEPTGNLDAETGVLILDLLRDLVKQEGATLMVVTHSLQVARTADRLLTLELGQLAERQGAFAW